MGVTDFVSERTFSEEHLSLRKSVIVSEEGHSDCKFQIIAIRAWRDMFSAKFGLSGPIKRI